MAYKCLENTEVVCSVCQAKPAAVHHIVKRGAAPFLVECIYNMKGLCEKHHRQVHRDAEMDREFKREMQHKLEFLFYEEYYPIKSIKNILGINDKAISQLVKTIPFYPNKGYKKEDIIKRCMGGRNYL